MSTLVSFEKIGYNFQNRHFQSVLIFAILSHPFSFLLKNRPFGVFLPQEIIIFRIRNTLTVIYVMDGWMDGRTDGRTDERTDRWMDFGANVIW